MDVLRCPTCLGMLVEPKVQRCPICHQRLDRRSPVVLAARGMPLDVSTLHPRKTGWRRKGRHFGSRGDVK